MGALRVESRWSPPPAPFTAGDQRLHEHVMPVNRWPTTADVYGVDCISGSRGVTYHASGGDGASGRTYKDQLMMRNFELCQHERPEEPFSFWNMGSYKGTILSSSFCQASETGRKRDFNMDDFVSTKVRKLDSEG